MGYLIPVPACLLAWAGHLALVHYGAVTTPYLPFFIAIIFSAVMGGIGPGLLAIVILECIASNIFFPLTGVAPPIGSGNPVTTLAVLTAAIGSVLFANYGAGSAVKQDQTARALRAINENLEARITERSAALLEAEENLRQAKKMEAVGQLTGGIAHDFNNLLTGIMGSMERLEARLTQAPPDELRRYIDAASDATARAANLTNRLLAFSRRQPLNPRGTDINRLIGGMADLITRTIGPAISLDITPCPHGSATLVDPNQLEHALLNLCINASDAMPGGGVLSITTTSASLTPAQAGPLGLTAGDYVSLTVADTGTGMTPEVLARAFDPFFTTKPLGQGTGLGLSMIYGFARQSGGHTEVLSTPGAGTAVTLYLPRHHGQVDSPVSTPCPVPCPAPLPANGLGESILLVDDEPSIRLLAAEVLQERGYIVHQACDAEDALQFLRHGEPVDMLITDLGLPGISGRELAETGLIMRPDMKILFITGYGDRTQRPIPVAPPGQTLLNKPFSMTTLAARVQEMLSA
jgi:signal transduction histidine kinase